MPSTAHACEQRPLERLSSKSQKELVQEGLAFGNETMVKRSPGDMAPQIEALQEVQRKNETVNK